MLPARREVDQRKSWQLARRELPDGRSVVDHGITTTQVAEYEARRCLGGRRGGCRGLVTFGPVTRVVGLGVYCQDKLLRAIGEFWLPARLETLFSGHSFSAIVVLDIAVYMLQSLQTYARAAR